MMAMLSTHPSIGSQNPNTPPELQSGMTLHTLHAYAAYQVLPNEQFIMTLEKYVKVTDTILLVHENSQSHCN